MHVRNLGLVALFAGALAFQAFRIAQSWGGAWWVFDCASGAAVCGLALARHRDRLWTAVAGLALALAAFLLARLLGLPAEPSPAMALGLCVLVGSALGSLPPLSAGLIAAAGLAVLTPPPFWLLNDACWLAAVAFGLGPRLMAARRRDLIQHVRRAERLTLARELHDVVAHHVTSIVLQAQAAQLVARKRPGSAESSLADIETAGSQALAATRRVVGLLREQTPAAPAEGRLSELVAAFHGPEAHLSLPDGEPRWAPEVAATIYRVVQESLTNISRHAAGAAKVTVEVRQEGDTIEVEVADDAHPARPARRDGYGLVGMRERLEALGGTLSAGPRPEAGWSVLATLPKRS